MKLGALVEVPFAGLSDNVPSAAPCADGISTPTVRNDAPRVRRDAMATVRNDPGRRRYVRWLMVIYLVFFT